MAVRNTTEFLTITLILLVSFARPVEAGGNDRLLRNVDPRLRPLMQSALTKSESSSNPFTTVKPVGIDRTGNELYGVIVYTDNPGALVHAGVEVESRFPTFVTVRAALNLIRTIADLPGVQWIEAGGDLRPSLNVSVPKTGADKVRSGLVDGIPYKGAGVIVGVIDTGIDWKHLDFRSDTDTTKSRILFLWDQTLTKTGAEKTPRDRDLTLPDYGVEYLQTEVNDEIDGFPPSFVREQDTNDHGTHVAGIAAGDGSSSASGFVGMAPEADLIVVKAGNASFPSANIIDGIAYVNKKAADLGKPFVLNLSLGGHTGAHDGTDGEEIALDNILGGPGKVAVVAAGNEGSRPIHAGGTVAEGGSTFVEFSIPTYTPMSGNQNDFVVLDMWYDGTDAMSVTVRTPSGATVTALSGTPPNRLSSDDGFVFIDNASLGFNPLNEAKNCIIQVFDDVAAKPPASGTWRVTIGGTLVNSGGRFDVWVSNTSDPINDTNFTTGADNSRTVGTPGTSTEAITVASFVTKTSWKSVDGKTYVFNPSDTLDSISEFSSRGPTRDGRLKPDIAAPGEGIVSALSKDATPGTPFVLQDNRHLIQSGTSQATPHAAGAAALLLQMNPSLTAAEVKSALTATAKADAKTGSVPNFRWGYGKLDAFGAASTLVTSLEQVSASVPTEFVLRQNYPNPFNPTTTIEFEVAVEGVVNLRVFDQLGREVSRIIDRQSMTPGQYRVQWNTLSSRGEQLASGVYFYRLEAAEYSAVRKMIVIR